MDHLHQNCEGIDAAVFSGDMLWDDKRRASLKEYIARWGRAITQHEAPEPPASGAPEEVVQKPPESPRPTELVERLRHTPNWMRESYGSWKDCVLRYDRAPFEAADEIERLRAALTPQPLPEQVREACRTLRRGHGGLAGLIVESQFNAALDRLLDYVEGK